MLCSIAETKPRCWSEMTSWTPCRPRSRNEPRNSFQNTRVSASPTLQPQHFSMTVGGDTSGNDNRLGYDPPRMRALQYVASRKTYGVAWASNGRVRNASTSVS